MARKDGASAVAEPEVEASVEAAPEEPAHIHEWGAPYRNDGRAWRACRGCDAVEQIEAAEAALDPDEKVPALGDPREAVVRILEKRLERMLQPVDDPSPVAWLEDGEHDRLYWAIARARGRAGGSTTEDEQDARAILDELRKTEAAEHLWAGVYVITRRDLGEALTAPLPPASSFSASVRTPAFIYVDAICPVCGIAGEISIEITAVLTVEAYSRKLKAKASDLPHQCGQQRLRDLVPTRPVKGQTALDLDEDEDLDDSDVGLGPGGNPDALTGFPEVDAGNGREQDDDEDLRPTGEVNVDELRGAAERDAGGQPSTPLAHVAKDERLCDDCYLPRGHEGDHDPDALPF